MSRGDPAGRGAPPAVAPPPLPRGDEPLGELLFGDAPELALEAPRDAFGSSTVSGEIFAAVRRRTVRLERVALGVALAAVVVGAAGVAGARWLRSTDADAVAAAHLEASDRLVAEGRLVGDGGAIERLLAAKRLRPQSAAADGRLARIADLLEALAARAVERGDLAVAEVHLGWARQVAPDRASVRAALGDVATRARGGAATAQHRAAEARPAGPGAAR